jgi:hypothetical protein
MVVVTSIFSIPGMPFMYQQMYEHTGTKFSILGMAFTGRDLCRCFEAQGND